MKTDDMAEVFRLMKKIEYLKDIELEFIYPLSVLDSPEPHRYSRKNLYYDDKDDVQIYGDGDVKSYRMAETLDKKNTEGYSVEFYEEDIRLYVTRCGDVYMKLRFNDENGTVITIENGHWDIE